MKKFLIGSLFFAAPAVAFGQIGSATVSDDANTLVVGVLGFITDIVIPLIFIIAVVFFLYGLMKFVLNAGDEAARETGKSIMIWGTVALFVMLSIFAIIKFLQGTFGVDDADTNIPTVIDIPDYGSSPGVPQ